MLRRGFLQTITAAAATAAWVPRPTFAAESVGELANHQIAKIDFRTVDLRWPRHVGRNAVLDAHGHGPQPTACVLTTKLGATGWGLIRGDERSVREIADRVVGRPLSELFVREVGIVAPWLAPLDIALHDLAGVVLDVPVWQLIAPEPLAAPHLPPIYSGMIYFDDLDPADQPAGIAQLVEECRWDYEYGYRQFKLKIGRGHRWMQPKSAGLERDIAAVNTIAETFPDCDLLVDANNGYTIKDCLAFLSGVRDVPLFWVEEPFHENVADYRKLRTWMKSNGFERTYLADGEANPDTPVLDQLGREGVLDVRLEDIQGLGFTAWRKFLPQLAAQQVATSPHTWGEGLKTIYVAHLAGALGNTMTIEGVTCSHDDVDFGEHQIADGKLQLSTQPGFGLTLRD